MWSKYTYRFAFVWAIMEWSFFFYYLISNGHFRLSSFILGVGWSIWGFFAYYKYKNQVLKIQMGIDDTKEILSKMKEELDNFKTVETKEETKKPRTFIKDRK
jgi:hypothetical protein